MPLKAQRPPTIKLTGSTSYITMFNYTSLNARMQKTRGSMDIAVGDWVRSSYRARWWGIVQELHPNSGLATVLQVLDQRGNPIRKPKTVRYHCHWFNVTGKPDFNNMKKFTCTTEGCDAHHCPKCGRHYEPCAETARANKCDRCILGQVEQETDAQTKAFNGNYEEAAKWFNW